MGRPRNAPGADVNMSGSALRPGTDHFQRPTVGSEGGGDNQMTFIDRPQLHQSLSLPPLSSVCSQSHHNTTAAAGVLVSAAVREGSWGF
ncbi:unnamed protein product [Boreogadus saida]